MNQEFIVRHMTGRTIKSLEIIRAEYGRSYDYYGCFIFTDGSKLLLEIGEPYSPKPDVEEMKKAPNYFSPEDIGKAVEKNEREKRRRKESAEEKERLKYEELKIKFEGTK